MVKEITAEQVAKQKYDKRKMSSPCWIIIHNDVYDVSKFLHEVGTLNCFIRKFKRSLQGIFGRRSTLN